MSFIKLLKLWENLRSGYWFIPALLAVGSASLTVLCPWLDARFPGPGKWIAEHGYLIDAEGSRTILSVIAASAITVAGVVFSITMVVLATMAAQFGPRLLPNFMRQESTKVVLGGFIGTFVYCMLALSQLTGQGEREDIPKLTVSVGLILGIFSFGLLIYFIHRVARFIQAPCILQDVADRLRTNIINYFPERAKHDRENPATGEGSFNPRGAPLTLEREGYIQVIDMDALVNWATEANTVVQLMKRPGQFNVEDDVVLQIRDQETLSEDAREMLRRAFITGVSRTDTQDVEFAVDQLVEVAVRAMSPGINDPYTAINCIDHLGGALALLSTRNQPPHVLRDENGHPRLWRKSFTIPGILNLAFDPLRQNGRGIESVAIHLMDVMVSLAGRDLADTYRQALIKHAGLLRADVEKKFIQSSDRDEFERRYDRFTRSLEARSG